MSFYIDTFGSSDSDSSWNSSPPPSSPPPYYAPVYYEPPPDYSYYYSPPSYDYTPPSYDYTPPSYDIPTNYADPIYDFLTPSVSSPYSWSAPSYSWEAPSYEYSYQDPVLAYKPDPYGSSFENQYSPYDMSRPSYSEFLYTTDPYAYSSEQIKEYVEGVYGVPYQQYERDQSLANVAAFGAGVGTGGADNFDTLYNQDELGNYYDVGSSGSFYGSDALGGSDSSSYGEERDAFLAPGGVDATAFDTFNLPQNQFAAISPQFSDTMSDSYESPMAGALSRSLGVDSGIAAPVASGAGIVPSASGGFELQTGSGDVIKLNDADTQDLLSGRTTVAELAAAKAESGVERLSPTTVATEDLSLEAPYGYGPNGRPLASDPAFAAAQREIADMNEARTAQGRGFELVGREEENPFLNKSPGFNPATMEAGPTFAERQAAEMARAEAGVPANQAEYEAYLAARQPYNVDQYVTPANQRSFDEAMQGITDRGGFTSQWQTVGSDRVMVNDDGTGIGINENGESYALSKQEVDQMIANKQLNTRESGYVGATGGRGEVPGGSPKGPPFKFDAKAESGKGGGGGGGGGGSKDDKKKKGGISPALLLGLLAALAANRGKGGAATAGIPALALQRAQTGYGGAGRRAGSSAQQYFTGPGIVSKANGGMLGYEFAEGGIASLGGYSDGGRLLRGPGDGVSDSIPAMIGKKQPARLADGEFVVPARIVSELGNGSTDAGARKLYAMMDRVQKDRSKSVGKNKVAVNSRADKHLPK